MYHPHDGVFKAPPWAVDRFEALGLVPETFVSWENSRPLVVVEFGGQRPDLMYAELLSIAEFLTESETWPGSEGSSGGETASAR